MQYNETTKMKRERNEELQEIGRIELKHIAKPETVQVIFENMLLEPTSFDIFGNPIFEVEICERIAWKNKALRKKGQEEIPIKVLYEEAELDFDVSSINTIKGIEKYLYSIGDFMDFINRRAIYNKANPGKKLREYVIFGKYLCLENGDFRLLKEDIKGYNIPKVCTKAAFDKLKENKSSMFFYKSYEFPKPESRCPWCTMKFTIHDIQISNLEKHNDKFLHLSCLRHYNIENEIDMLIRQIMDFVYTENMTFEIRSNRYNWGNKKNYFVRFICHTPDGDIELERTEEGIMIDWNQNYKSFDMSIFGSENVKKWDRGILAYYREYAFEYLKKAKEAANQQ